MALAEQRDLDDLAQGVARWLMARRAFDDAEIMRCERASGGLSSETLMVDVHGTRDGHERDDALVVRLAPPGAGVFPEYDLAAQAAAQTVAAAHGVPTAEPVELEPDPSFLGAPFLVMPMIAGHVPGAATIHDPWVTGAHPEQQTRLFHHVLDVLATVHTIGPDASGLAGAVVARDLDAELAAWRRYLAWYGDGEELVPALTAALDWCAAHRPAADPPSALLWGDVRLGNVIFDDARDPVAVLDWEMTTIGAPEHDVAWFLALEGMQNDLFGTAVPGFPDRDAAIAYYEAAAGRRLVDPAWFEIFALVRSNAIMIRLMFLRQQRATTPRAVPVENPLLDLLDRRIGAYT